MPNIAAPGALKLRQMVNWRLSTTTASSGMGLDGRQQFIRRENRTWVCSYTVLEAWDNRGAYLAWLDNLAGAANTFTLPVPNFSLMASGTVLFLNEDGDFVTEDGDFLVVGINQDVVLTAPASAGASQITVSATNGLLMQPGVVFSRNDFLYRVASQAAGVVQINPPLRGAIANGATLFVTNPKIRVRLADDAAGVAAHEFSQMHAPYTLSVIEAFDR